MEQIYFAVLLYKAWQATGNKFCTSPIYVKTAINETLKMKSTTPTDYHFRWSPRCWQAKYNNAKVVYNKLVIFATTEVMLLRIHSW